MSRRYCNLAAACASFALSVAAWAGEAAAPSEKDWQDALAAVRAIALDESEAEEHRIHAVAACVKLLIHRQRHDNALGFCRDVLKSAERPSVLEAALRAGCLVARSRHGHLRAELDLLATLGRGGHAHAVAAIGRELTRTVQTLEALAAKTMVPQPVVPQAPRWAVADPGKAPAALHFAALAAPAPAWYPQQGKAPGALRVVLPKMVPPSWYRFEPGKAHPALRVTHPKMEPPHWYGRVAFPPLKDPKKK